MNSVASWSCYECTWYYTVVKVVVLELCQAVNLKHMYVTSMVAGGWCPMFQISECFI